jgi:hypothetical protein
MQVFISLLFWEKFTGTAHNNKKGFAFKTGQD